MKRSISIVGQVGVIVVSLLLFWYAFDGLCTYDKFFSDGSDEGVWVEPGGLDDVELLNLIFWCISLVVTGFPFWSYFHYLKFCSNKGDYLSLPLFRRDMHPLISSFQSLAYVAMVICFDVVYLSMLLPQNVTGYESFDSLMSWPKFLLVAIWPFALIGIFIHEILFFSTGSKKKMRTTDRSKEQPDSLVVD